MAASITETLMVGTKACRYTWSGTAPYTVYLKGDAVLQNTDQTEYTAQWTDALVEPPAIEVIDSTESAATLQQVLHSPKITLQFRGRRTNSYYVAQLWDGAAWAYDVTIIEDGRGYYQVDAGFCETADYLFRVTPYDASGTAGTPLQFSIFHHTNPTPPELSYTYDSGTGNLTVDAI